MAVTRGSAKVACDMAVQSPNPPRLKRWRIVTWRAAESKARRRGWSRKREEWFGTGQAATPNFCGRITNALQMCSMTLSGLRQKLNRKKRDISGKHRTKYPGTWRIIRTPNSATDRRAIAIDRVVGVVTKTQIACGRSWRSHKRACSAKARLGSVPLARQQRTRQPSANIPDILHRRKRC